MIRKQRENVAKYLYDLSKIVFATTVVGNVVDQSRFNLLVLFAGGILSWVFLEWGYALDGATED